LGHTPFSGGLARRKLAFEEIRKESPHLVILDAGNALSPHYYSRIDRGELTFYTLDALHYDALNLGSHDFDYGKERLWALKQSARNIQFLSSNVYEKTSGKPWAPDSIIKEVNGLKIGILGICDARAEQEALLGGFSGLEARDPRATLVSLVPMLRPQVQLLVLLSNMPPHELKPLLENVEGIDIAISRSAGGRTDYDDQTSPTAYDFHYLLRASSSSSVPQIRTVVAYASRFGFEAGRMDVTFEGNEIKQIQPSVVVMPVGSPEDQELASRIETRKKTIEQEYGAVLLDRLEERLGKPWNEAGFIHMGLVMMKDFASSEIAVINENFFYKPQVIHEQIRKRGRLVLWDIHRLFWTNNHLVKVRLSGAQIRKLFGENKGNGYLRFLGLAVGPQGAVLANGRPIKDQELYSVATSNYLAFGVTAWPALSQGKNPQEAFGGKTVVLRDLVIQALEEDLKRGDSPEAWANRYQMEKAEPYPTQWFVLLDRLALNFSSLGTHNRGSFASVRDARVKALDQVTAGTAGSISLTFDHALLLWRNAMELGYSQVTLPNDVVNNPMDQMVFKSQVQGQKLRVPLGRQWDANPSLAAAYDTEFSPTPGNPRRRLLRLEPGLSTTLGGLFNEVRLSGVAELDYSLPPLNTEYGAGFSSKFLKPWRNRSLFSSDIEFFYFFPSARDTADDLLWQGSFRHRLAVPLWGDLALAPYLDVFAWRGKLIRSTGWNFLAGVSLSYSQLWKP
jgi:2',3'-cyclic-nucleotide 2'-phosphodiesterase (5'-nucleotidase family)